jgi:hypothetical protein
LRIADCCRLVFDRTLENQYGQISIGYLGILQSSGPMYSPVKGGNLIISYIIDYVSVSNYDINERSSIARSSNASLKQRSRTDRLLSRDDARTDLF